MKGIRTSSPQFKNVLDMLQGEDYATVALGVTFWSQMGPYNKWKIYNKLYSIYVHAPRTSIMYRWAFYSTIKSCTMDIIRDGKTISIFFTKTRNRINYMNCHIGTNEPPF